MHTHVCVNNVGQNFSWMKDSQVRYALFHCMPAQNLFATDASRSILLRLSRCVILNERDSHI